MNEMTTTNKIHQIYVQILADLDNLDKEISFKDILKRCNNNLDTALFVQQELMESRFINLRQTRDNNYFSRRSFFVFERDGLI